MAQRYQLFSIQEQRHIQNSIMHKWIQKPFVQKFYQLPPHLCLYYLYQQNLFRDSFWGKLLPLIIKPWGALLNTNDHIKWKNNIEGWQPEHLPTLIPEYPNHLPWKYWCEIFFLILIYRLIKFRFNFVGYYWGNRLLRKYPKEKLLKKIKGLTEIIYPKGTTSCLACLVFLPIHWHIVCP